MATLSGFRKALKRTASLLPVIPKTRPLYRGNHAITILRIFLWLIPAIVIPVMAYSGGVVTEYLRIPVSISLMLMLLLVVAATAGIGLFEELLTFQQMRETPANPKRELVVSTICFVLLQIFIVPTVWLTVYIVFYIAYSIRLLVT